MKTIKYNSHHYSLEMSIEEIEPHYGYMSKLIDDYVSVTGEVISGTETNRLFNAVHHKDLTGERITLPVSVDSLESGYYQDHSCG